MCQHHPVELLFDMAELHTVGLEEVASCRHIEKQILHRNGSSVSGSSGSMLFHFRTLYQQQSACAVLGHLSAQFHMGNSGDRSQGLASEALGSQVEKIVSRTEFGGSMPFEAQAGVVKTHALAIIHHLYQGASGILDNQLDIVSARVHGVFEQFLHYGGRPLDDLTGRNLIGHRIG